MISLHQEQAKKVSCLLLCAGKSQRMGQQNKLLLNLGSHSLLKRVAQEIREADFNEVIVVTGHGSSEVTQELKDFPFKTVHNEDFEKGVHASIRRGLLEVKGETHFVAICLADQPLMKSSDYNLLISQAKAHPEALLVAPVFEGQRGNPVVISAKLMGDILEHEDNDRGCFYLFERYPEHTIAVEMPTSAIMVDVDTPLIYETLRAQFEESIP